MKATTLYGLAAVWLGLLIQGCSQYLHQPFGISKARLGAETPQFQELALLPPPKEKIVAAVYKFRDQTGQYKEMEGGSSWSTAVTQGATSILLRAMEESGWFIPIEREGLSNLLNERKIIRSSMANYSEKDINQLLPPLVFAGILLEGGIISFDSNIMTGGAGARYFGSGMSTQYREDRVTIYLRAVSTSNGRILKTVYTSKSILSQQVDAGVFRFVNVRRLMEAETGFTYNEPGEMAVKEAIEKAIYGLIVEGIIERLWQVKNEMDLNSEAVIGYVAEKDANKGIDVFGAKIASRRDLMGVGFRGTGLLYEGDYDYSRLSPGGEFHLEYYANRPFSIGMKLGAGQIRTGEEFKATLAYTDFGVKYRFLNLLQTTPYVRLGAGMATEFSNSYADDATHSYARASAEFGTEYLITSKIGLNGALDYHLLFTDELDRLVLGKYDDTIWSFNLGLTFYMSKREVERNPKRIKIKRKKLTLH